LTNGIEKALAQGVLPKNEHAMTKNVHRKSLKKSKNKLTIGVLRQESHVTHGTLMGITAQPVMEKFHEFPAQAREHLNSFYRARHISPDDVRGKINALRAAFDMEKTVIAADGGINDDAMELRALEFYVLTKLGLI
jgi:hypothetical protein